MASANSKARRRLFRGILPAAAVAVLALGGAAQAAPASHVASSQHAAFAGSFFDATRGLTSASACCDDSGSVDDSGNSDSPSSDVGDTPTSDPTDFGDGSTSDTGSDMGSDTGSDMGSDTSTDPGADTGSDTSVDPSADQSGDQGQDPAADPAPDQNQDPAADPAPDQNQDPAADPAPDQNQDPAADPAPDQNQDPAADPAPDPAQMGQGQLPAGYDDSFNRGTQSGQCTAWAMQQRPDLIKAIDAAVSNGDWNQPMLIGTSAGGWADIARKAGRPVGKEPHVGDLMVEAPGTTMPNDQGGSNFADPVNGHVAVVESVNRDANGNPVSFTVSEMHAPNLGEVTRRTIPISGASANGVDFVG